MEREALAANCTDPQSNRRHTFALAPQGDVDSGPYYCVKCLRKVVGADQVTKLIELFESLATRGVELPGTSISGAPLARHAV